MTLVKRYRGPIYGSYFIAKQIRHYVDAGDVLSVDGPKIELDVSFADGVSKSVSDDVHSRMLADGWEFVGDVGVELPAAKAEKYKAIDRRTDEIIAQGFEFPPGGGRTFSLSPEAQLRIHGCDYARDLLSYPVKWPTLDDNEVTEIPDADTIHSFFLVALSTLRAVIDSGTDLKKQVADAVTRDEVDAVTDER